MRKIKRKNILILIVLLIAILFEIKVFTSSRANRLIEITANIIDEKGMAKQETITLQATNQGESGYAITLPSMVEGKKIETYLIEAKPIVSQNATKEEQNTTTNIVANEVRNRGNDIAENSINNTTDNTASNTTNKAVNTLSSTTLKAKSVYSMSAVQEEPTAEDEVTALAETQVIEETDADIQKEVETAQVVEKTGGETLYLTQEELDSQTIELTVQYDSKQVENEMLYAKIIQNEEQENAVTVEGYLPEEATVNMQQVSQEEVEGAVEEGLSENVEVQLAYDIKIMLNEKEYTNKSQDELLKVTIAGIENLDTSKQRYAILHIHGDEVKIIEDIKISENSITFETDKFSTYALLSEATTYASQKSDISLMSLDVSEMSDATDTWDGSSSSGFRFGDGSQASPYLITKASELSYLAKQVNSGNSFDGKYFQVTNDINLDSRNWTPVGNTTNPFQGIFDGAGHIIANATIAIDSIPTGNVDSYGIFGSIGGGTSETIIRNIEFNSIEISIEAGGSTSVQTTPCRYTHGMRSWNYVQQV